MAIAVDNLGDAEEADEEAEKEAAAAAALEKQCENNVDVSTQCTALTNKNTVFGFSYQLGVCSLLFNFCKNNSLMHLLIYYYCFLTLSSLQINTNVKVDATLNLCSQWPQTVLLLLLLL